MAPGMLRELGNILVDGLGEGMQETAYKPTSCMKFSGAPNKCDRKR